jgi:signal transduction histidine kinase
MEFVCALHFICNLRQWIEASVADRYLLHSYMKRSIRIYWLYVLMLPLYLFGQQTTSYSRFHFTDENGFLQNIAYQIGTNKMGYTWILSEYGLGRLDGTTVKNYLNSTYISSPGKRFSNLLWDLEGNVYAYHSSSTSELFLLQAHPQKLPTNDSNQFYTSDFNQLLFLRDVKKENQKKTQQLLANTHSFYYTPAHELYVIEKNELQYLNEQGESRIIALEKNAKIIPVASHVLLTYPDATVQVIYKGIVLNNKRSNDTLEISSPVTLVVNSSGTFLLKNDNLYKIRIDQHIVSIQLLLKTMGVQDASDVVIDIPTETILIASSTDALYAFKKQRFRPVVSSLNYTYINNFYEQVEFSDGSIFSMNAMVDTNGVIHPQTVIKNSDRSALISNSKDELYFSDGASLLKTTKQLSDVKKIAAINGPTKGFFYQQDTLWMASTNEVAYLLNDSLFKFFHLPSGNKGNPEANEITCILDHSKDIWIGTRNGLFILSKNEPALTPIEELKNKRISYLTNCTDGSVFIGTKGQGAFLYSKGHCLALPMDKNNSLSTVNAAIGDQHGFLWISTNKGLLKTSQNELKKFTAKKTASLYYHYYYKEDGFATNEFNNATTSPIIVKKNGQFSFSSLKGLVWFNPSNFKPDEFPRHVFIEELSADGEQLKLNQEIKLPSSHHTFSVHVSVPYWGNRNNTELSYTLSGMEDHWYPVEESEILHFNKLQAGFYTLKIRVRTGFGDADFADTQLSFQVLPAWYETTVFKVIVIFLLGLIFYLILRWRLAAIKREKVRLDMIITDKTQELNVTIEKLKSTVNELTDSQDDLNKAMEQKEKLTSILAHDLRTPLQFMTMISEHLNKNIHSLSPEKLHELTAELKNSSRSTFAFADELLTWLGIQRASFKLRFQEHEIGSIIQDTCIYFQDIAAKKNIQLITQLQEHIFAKTDERLLKIILRNVIDNAIKNTASGTIIISGAIVNGEFKIEIEDTGRGMSFKELEEINQTNSFGFSFEIKEKLGFQIIRDFTIQLHGRIQVESELDKGTRVILYFPLTG